MAHADEADTPATTFGGDLEISTLATDQIIVATSELTVREAAKVMSDESIGLLVLKEGDDTVGVISERDVLRAVANSVDLDSSAVSVGNIDNLKFTAASATVGDVANEMMANYVRHVLIAGDDGKPEGIVSVRDLLAVIVS